MQRERDRARAKDDEDELSSLEVVEPVPLPSEVRDERRDRVVPQLRREDAFVGSVDSAVGPCCFCGATLSCKSNCPVGYDVTCERR